MKSPRCKWIGDIAHQSRKIEVARLRTILTDPEVGVLHIFGDKGIGKRTLVQCLAQELLSGTPAFAKVFLIDLLSDPIALEEWSIESCDWMSRPDLPSGSLLDMLQVLFSNGNSDDPTSRGDASHQGDLADDPQSRKPAKQESGDSDTQRDEVVMTGTPYHVETKEGLHVTQTVSGTGTVDSSKAHNDGDEVPKKTPQQERMLLVLRDYGDPGLQKRTIEEEAVVEIMSLLEKNRLALIILSEANLLDRSHNESQRLGAYQRLYRTTKGWQFKVGLLSTKADAESAIRLSLERMGLFSESMSPPAEYQISAILQAAGPHPGQTEQAVVRLTSHTVDSSLEQYLVDALLQANRAVYEATWNGLQQREKSVLLTYSLVRRDKLSRADAQSKLERLIEDFSVTATDFDDVEKKRGLPWSRVGQCLLPWSSNGDYKFFSEAFAAFVEQKLPSESSIASTSNWRTYVRTPMFLFLMFFASMAIGLAMLLLTMAFDLPRLLAVFIPLVPVFAFFAIFLFSHVPVLKR